jgi:NAD(P)-dependent dehydrogenase (short-subunit alcohol dehydrogenase family)
MRVAREPAQEDQPRTTIRTALRRPGTPEDGAGAVLFFASDLSASDPTVRV